MQAEDDTLTGYPRDKEDPHLIRVDHKPAKTGFGTTHLPTETLRITRIPKADVQARFDKTLAMYLSLSRSNCIFKTKERVYDLLKVC